jgi:hypothetical protein
MTQAQKNAQANFKKAIAYRKKSGCTLKEAFAQVKKTTIKGLDGVVKKGNKTTVLYSKNVAVKKATQKKKVVKPAKKQTPKIKVVKQQTLFGIGTMTYKQEIKKYVTRLDDCLNEIVRTEKDITDLKFFIKDEKGEQKKASLKLLNNFKKYLIELKKHKTELKKLI